MLINMKELLSIAKKNQFAVPAFNIGSLEILKAVIEGAEELNAPVILEIHPTEIEYLTDAFAETVKRMAYEAKVPVVIHLDHGGTKADIIRAINCGFTSVMIDGSTLSYEENVELTKEVSEIAHSVNVSVEGEIGTIGNTGLSFEGGTSEIIYADPRQAEDFIQRTNVDTLAVAIGTAHGLYPKDFKPKLNLDILREINNITDIPLVLHGGSGNPDEEVSAAAKLGICKVNISSDVKSVFFNAVKKYMKENPDEYEPNQIFPSCILEAKKVIKHKLELLNTVNKADLY
ncbi:ketose-bisphosphate aldolase [Clostridium estertheticum]|uniref:ketose-bisphosphate aldolase n=1 Tax=Clostridium estertheticum TaxID=238834 RepID=UPI001C0B45EF|nr:ketose-bisphosphate aldolase [Clostridium estertheticum]MBU3217474.1 ketose-bisphosphate aldolase [Clostridium estertheticum]MBW9172485.1 ketose-bisphosphate aldolase [Clostridium estertheticum]WAG56654.1 ketose-bisphosphate aldolase [Clostridium estertheticum]WLC76555.1 ketose-bisphosphate aldolase [Clostridium estertheticum]